MSRVKLDQPNVNGLHSENASKIDTIKELLFGDTINEYDSEFQALKKDILRKRKELESLIKTVREDFDKSIDELGNDLDKKLAGLEINLNKKADKLQTSKVDKKVLGNLLVKLGEKIGQ